MCDYWEEYRVGGLCSKCGRDVDSDGNVEGEVVRILCQNKRDGDGWPPLHAALDGMAALPLDCGHPSVGMLLPRCQLMLKLHRIVDTPLCQF